VYLKAEELIDIGCRIAILVAGSQRVTRFGYTGKGTQMATLDWSQCPAVESVADWRSGTWVFKDTRMPVAQFLKILRRVRARGNHRTVSCDAVTGSGDPYIRGP
jgi:CheY-like chemotaxis protein